jgi:DNA-3-methyladenine glycosylase
VSVTQVQLVPLSASRSPRPALRATPRTVPRKERTIEPATTPLPPAFYARPTLAVAHDLIGKTLWRRAPEGLAGGIIVEAEAYVSASDPAAHGHRGITARTAVMYGPPGRAYVYFTYGMHYCLNAVAEPNGTGAAVLIRALQPSHGLDLMRARRGSRDSARVADRDLARGPARLCQALALTTADNGADLTRGPDGTDLAIPALWITATPDWPPATPISTSPRVGITRATDLPWRFFVPGNPYVSGRAVPLGTRQP